MAISIVTTPATLRKIGGGWSISGSGGNSRGEAAVDLQTVRAQADQVASGNRSVIGGGRANTASGDYAAVGGGELNTASGIRSAVGGGESNSANGEISAVGGGRGNQADGIYAMVAGGYNNTASGYYTVVGGGVGNAASGNGATVGGRCGNTASGRYAVVSGGAGGVADKPGQYAHAAGGFNANGDAQTSVLLARNTTANAIPTELFIDGIAARCTIKANTTWAFAITVVARRTDLGNESAAYQFLGCVANNAGTTALVGSVAKTVIAEDSAAWDCNVTADDANDALIITATGEAGKTIQWVARIELVETTT